MLSNRARSLYLPWAGFITTSLTPTLTVRVGVFICTSVLLSSVAIQLLIQKTT
jgi:hypothetical protein